MGGQGREGLGRRAFAVVSLRGFQQLRANPAACGCRGRRRVALREWSSLLRSWGTSRAKLQNRFDMCFDALYVFSCGRTVVPTALQGAAFLAWWPLSHPFTLGRWLRALLGSYSMFTGKVFRDPRRSSPAPPAPLHRVPPLLSFAALHTSTPNSASGVPSAPPCSVPPASPFLAPRGAFSSSPSAAPP